MTLKHPYLFLFVVVLSLYFGVSSFQVSSDFCFHFVKAGGFKGGPCLQFAVYDVSHYPPVLSDDNVAAYAPLTSWLGFPFSFSQESFFLFWVVFLFIIVPFVSAFLLKNWNFPVFYFASAFPFASLYFFTIAQAFITFLGLVFIVVLSWKFPFRYKLLVLGAFLPLFVLAHSYGLYFYLFLVFFILLFSVFKAFVSAFFFPSVYFHNPSSLLSLGLPSLLLKFIPLPLFYFYRSFRLSFLLFLGLLVLSFTNVRFLPTASFFLAVSLAQDFSEHSYNKLLACVVLLFAFVCQLVV